MSRTVRSAFTQENMGGLLTWSGGINYVIYSHKSEKVKQSVFANLHCARCWAVRRRKKLMALLGPTASLHVSNIYGVDVGVFSKQNKKKKKNDIDI